ncbi:IPT/TIG domain-containing protein [Aquiflexum sp.]|uniref:IPT/TIG domain-containing protein n=1 Tax=Aquiflexum sp. TaxID=1872584 RepID=UPI0035945954
MSGSKNTFGLLNDKIAALAFLLLILISCAEIFDLPEITMAPRITSIEPEEGPEGTIVTITGIQFSPNSELNKVRFNGKIAIITESTVNTIKAIVPEDAGTGPVEVVVENKATQGPDFKFLYYPAILTVEPLEGKPGAEVVLTGKYFAQEPDANLVQFGGRTATVLSTDSTTKLTVSIPADAQSGAVTVTVNGLTGIGPFFKVLPTEQPVHSISGIEPTNGKAGTVVKINGVNFSPVAANNLVKFKDAPAEIISASPEKLEVFAPEVGISGIVSVTIAGLIANGPVFTYVMDPPVISQYVPDSGYSGDTVQIIGENFSAIPTENLVKFNGKDAKVLESTGLILKVIVPNDAGKGPVTITVGGQTGTGPDFNYLDNTPFINDFNPKSGPVGTSVVIQGGNFGNDPNQLLVRFNGVEAVVSKVENGNSITVSVPQGATTGPISVTTNEKTATSQQNFSVTVASPPLMIVYPSNLRVRENLTIRGTNFSAEANENVLKIGDFNLEITFASTDRLEVYVPDGVSSGPMSLTVKGVKALYSGRGETTELEVRVNQWARTGGLNEKRHGHTATLLTDGRVLVAGGRNTNDFLNSVEIFNPETNTWAHSGYLHLERAQHSACLLADGKILFIGGFSPIGVLNQCEIYDPETGISNLIEPMNSPRALHSSVQLDEQRIMVISGTDGVNNLNLGRPLFLSSSEILNLNNNSWASVKSIEGTLMPTTTLYSHARYNSSIKLPDGKIFFAGYLGGFGGIESYCRIYDPSIDTWIPASKFTYVGVSTLDLTLLPNGEVLMVKDLQFGQFDLYKPQEDIWVKLGNNVLFIPQQTSTTKLDNGHILFAGGNSGGLFNINDAWPRHYSSIFDPNTGDQNIEIGNIIDRCWHTATKLNNGTVLITGGLGNSRISIASSEIFVPAK